MTDDQDQARFGALFDAHKETLLAWIGYQVERHGKAADELAGVVLANTATVELARKLWGAVPKSRGDGEPCVCVTTRALVAELAEALEMPDRAAEVRGPRVAGELPVFLTHDAHGATCVLPYEFASAGAA